MRWPIPKRRRCASSAPKRDEQHTRRAALSGLKEKPAVSRDGTKIRLLANIELCEDATHAADLGAKVSACIAPSSCT